MATAARADLLSCIKAHITLLQQRPIRTLCNEKCVNCLQVLTMAAAARADPLYRMKERMQPQHETQFTSDSTHVYSNAHANTGDGGGCACGSFESYQRAYAARKRREKSGCSGVVVVVVVVIVVVYGTFVLRRICLRFGRDW
jgi:cobalamin biosynthesis Mg chelatase CobN